MNTNTPSILARKTILVRQVRRSTIFRATNQAITSEVEAQHSATDAGAWQDKLIHKRYLAGIQAAMSKAYKWHQSDTLPFEISGARLLPLANKARYDDHQAECQRDLASAVAQLIADWPDAMADARSRLNGMFDESKYPSIAELDRRFGIEVYTYPTPDPGGIFADVTETQRQDMESELTARIAEISSNATYEIWRRLLSGVETLRDRLAAYGDKDADERKRFCSAWIDNLREVADMLPALNFADDPQLEAMRQRVNAELLSFDAAELKDSEFARRTVTAKADDIARALAGLMG